MAKRISKRAFLQSAGAAAAAASMASNTVLAAVGDSYDLIVVGGGNAGLPAAIFAAARGARVLIVEAAGVVGGTLFLSTGQMSAAGTKLQASKGIKDTAKSHYDDVMRISTNTADPVLVKLAVDNAAHAFDWLTDHGFQAMPDHPVTGTTHDPYSQPRYVWGPEGGRSILKVLNAQLAPHIKSGKVTVLTSTEVTGLVQDPNGSVRGVTTRNGRSETATYKGRYTLLTVGGYTRNVAMYEKYERARNYTNATYPYSRGKGLELALAAGGYVRGGEKHTPLFGAVLASETYPAAIRALARHYPGDRPPWEIFVNAEGKRFLQEDILSHTTYERSLAAQKDELCWVVFDEAILKKAPPLITAGIGGAWTPADTARSLQQGAPSFYRGQTPEALAAAAGFDPANFKKTLESYNRAQAGGKDALGRKFMPLPISKAPYYAVKLHSWNLTSYGGVAVDGQLRVVRKDGRAIPNLYAAGELLGMGALMGNSVPGGMSVMPALTFGRLLGNEILKFG